MTAAEIHAKLAPALGDALGALSEPKVDAFAVVKADRLLEAARFLKAEAGLELDHCDDVTAVDWPARNVIEVVYHLFSYRHRHGIVLKVECDRAAPVVPSVSGVWKAAVWLERECYDMFGVTFTGHPDLRRILLPDDWEGWPLRKDYAEAGGWHGITNVRENPLIELRRADEARLPGLRPPPAPPKPAAAAKPAAAPGEKPAPAAKPAVAKPAAPAAAKPAGPPTETPAAPAVAKPAPAAPAVAEKPAAAVAEKPAAAPVAAAPAPVAPAAAPSPAPTSEAAAAPPPLPPTTPGKDA